MGFNSGFKGLNANNFNLYSANWSELLIMPTNGRWDLTWRLKG